MEASRLQSIINNDDTTRWQLILCPAATQCPVFLVNTITIVMWFPWILMQSQMYQKWVVKLQGYKRLKTIIVHHQSKYSFAIETKSIDLSIVYPYSMIRRLILSNRFLNHENLKWHEILHFKHVISMQESHIVINCASL